MPNKWRTSNSQKFDFTVDEGKERLNPSREKNLGEHRRRKVDEKSCVTSAGTSTSLTCRINGNGVLYVLVYVEDIYIRVLSLLVSILNPYHLYLY